MFVLLIRPVFKLVYLSSKVEKSDTFLHNIHPGLFDPYIWDQMWRKNSDQNYVLFSPSLWLQSALLCHPGSLELVYSWTTPQCESPSSPVWSNQNVTLFSGNFVLKTLNCHYSSTVSVSPKKRIFTKKKAWPYHTKKTCFHQKKVFTKKHGFTKNHIFTQKNVVTKTCFNQMLVFSPKKTLFIFCKLVCLKQSIPSSFL